MKWHAENLTSVKELSPTIPIIIFSQKGDIENISVTSLKALAQGPAVVNK